MEENRLALGEKDGGAVSGMGNSMSSLILELDECVVRSRPTTCVVDAVQNNTTFFVHYGRGVAGPKGYRAVKQAVLRALQSGEVQHEVRENFDEKNLLGCGEVSVDEVISIVKASRGTDYSCSPLHADASCDCHLLKTRGWYVKFYFLEPHAVFISVHRTRVP
ncbi:hypothetical protein [Mitsuaria sp. GD03876]|uniref:hypothetical protein n=1 Tax=Mitsuaria sp. GD03876 TaxID=2975399 RepID=UPI00244896C1|nr:hypothetical protein [Mitsuaria sp. GD03876]MDH0866380.1 hypothetical protein [Mitsuaria sp. GD03876]